MKKTVIMLMLCFLLIASVVPVAFAQSPLLLDYAGLIDSPDEAKLVRHLEQLKNTYHMDIVILTTDTLMGESSVQAYADNFYEANYGPDGILFLVDMGSRQWHISTSGSVITLLSDSDLMEIEDIAVPYFSYGDFYAGFSRYLNILPELLNNQHPSGSSVNIMVALLIGAALSGLVLLIMRSTMNSKKPQHSAEDYQSAGSFHLRQKQDLFLYSNISKRPRPQNNNTGSTVHRSSSGGSHGGRGGRF